MMQFEAKALRLSSGPHVLAIESARLSDVALQMADAGGTPRLRALTAASAQLAGVKLAGPLAWPAGATEGGDAGATTWQLAPLAAAEGDIRARIVDAHLLFDADVHVPIRSGRVDFNDASVEHVGPDSRMGASRLGLYVDAPNGRSYLFQFPAPAAGVAYEKRNALLGPWVSDRGHLELQPFLEGLLGEGSKAWSAITTQARTLFDRTAVTGEVRLADGAVAAHGVRLELKGRDEGRNAVRLQAESVGRGFSAELPALSAARLSLDFGNVRVAADALNGSLRLGLASGDGGVRFELSLASLEVEGLALQLVSDPAS